jgi:hypothetical protein
MADKKWSSWKKYGDGLYIREMGNYPTIDGKRQFKFTQGITKGDGTFLTTRQRALDWKRGSPKGGIKSYVIGGYNSDLVVYVKTGPVTKTVGGYLYTETSKSVRRRK